MTTTSYPIGKTNDRLSEAVRICSSKDVLILEESRPNKVVVLSLKALEHPLRRTNQIPRILFKIEYINPNWYASARLDIKDTASG